MQRLWADLQINYALYKNLDSIRRLPLSRIVGWPLGERKKVAVLYGLPGTVVFLQFYGDLPLNRLHYSFMADDIQHMNPTLSITTEMIDVIFSHILQNEYREEPEEVIRSRVEHVRIPPENPSVLQAVEAT